MYPLFVRKFILDFVETAIAALFLLNIVFPNDVDQAKQVGIVVGAALLSSLVSALRRSAPEFLGWLKSKLGIS